MFIITKLDQRWQCVSSGGWRNVGPTRWRDVKPADKHNVAPTSPAYVAPTVLTTLGQRLFNGAVLQGVRKEFKKFVTDYILVLNYYIPPGQFLCTITQKCCTGQGLSSIAAGDKMIPPPR